MNRFAQRVGGVLVAPRETLARVAAGEGGFSDVMVLLVLRLVAGETQHLARAVLGLQSLGLVATLQAILQTAAALLPDILGILVGGVAMTLFAGARPAASSTQNAPVKGRELDLAACAWIPYLAVKVLFALVFSALQRPASLVEERIFDGIAIGWSVLLWALALWAIRKPQEAAPVPAAVGDAGGSR